MQQSTPSMWLLLTGSPYWQISDSWPRLGLIPEQRRNDDMSRDDERQSGNLVQVSGSSAHLVRESSLCWFMALLKHATENTFLLSGGRKAKCETDFICPPTGHCTAHWLMDHSLKFDLVTTLAPLFSDRVSLLVVSSFSHSLSYNQTYTHSSYN